MKAKTIRTGTNTFLSLQLTLNPKPTLALSFFNPLPSSSWPHTSSPTGKLSALSIAVGGLKPFGRLIVLMAVVCLGLLGSFVDYIEFFGFMLVEPVTAPKQLLQSHMWDHVGFPETCVSFKDTYHSKQGS